MMIGIKLRRNFLNLDKIEGKELVTDNKKNENNLIQISLEQSLSKCG